MIVMFVVLFVIFAAAAIFSGTCDEPLGAVGFAFAAVFLAAYYFK